MWRQRRKYVETEAEVRGDRGGSTWRQRRKYVETEAEVHGDREYVSVLL
jgi:hypothetical protein